MNGEIEVLIVDREAFFRRGLAAGLDANPNLRVVGSVGTAAEGYQQADDLTPNVALIGTTLTDAPGLEAATEMRRRFPAMASVVISDEENDEEFFAAIRAGASVYVGKDVPEEELISLIERAATGEYVINEQFLSKPYVAARVLEQFRNTTESEMAPKSAFAPLTDRELQILQKVSNGMTNAKIGVALGISPQTVKNHITSILRKLAVNDRTQAVVLALRRGWISIDEPEPWPGAERLTPAERRQQR